MSGGPTIYTVTTTGMTTSGTVIATILANRATDLAGNNNAASTSTDNTVTWDVTPPTVTINQAAAQADPTSTSPISYTVTFSEPVTGFVTGDVSFAGTAGGAKTGTVSGGPTIYTVTTTGMTTSGTVIATILANRATDLAGNTNAASTSTDNTVTWDVTPPTVTINQAAAQADPTNASPINFTVTFSEAVTGFATGDVSFTGSTVGGALVGTVSGAGPTYNVAVSGMTGTGTVVASIGAGVAADLAGNANAASTSTDNTVTFDNVAPSVTINQAVGQADPTGTSPILYTVTFSEPVTGFVTGDVTFAGTAGGAKTGTVSGGPTIYTVTTTGMTTSGTVIATILANRATDLAGNNNAASTSTDNTVTWDVTPPTVTINQAAAQADPTSTSPISYTVTFSEPVTGFVTGDVSFAGTAGGAKTGTVSGGPTIYTVTTTGMTTSGTVIATILANRATDLAGNTNAASTSTDNTVTWDVTPPTVTINQAAAQADPTNASPINFTVTFSEAVTGFATGDVSFTGSTVGGALVGTVSGAGPTYNVAVSGMTGTGTVVASIGAGVAADLAGNANAASTSADNTVTFDNVPPTVVIGLQAASDTGISNADNITNAASPVFDLAFSETVVGLLANDLSNVGTATGCTFGVPAGSGAAWTVTVTGCSEGTLIVRLRVNGVTDLAGNGNAVTNGATVTIDRTDPTVTINQALGQADPTNASPINFTAVFNETVFGFVTGDVAVGGSSGGVKTGTVSGGPTTYGVAVTGMTISGTVVASIAAAVATDTAGNGNAASTSADNTVLWFRATHVGFVQQPTDTIYRSTITPAVTVAILDASNNVVTESAATVSLTLAPAGPTLGGTLTVAAISGIATFSDLSVDQVGTYTLGATSGGLIGATSASFDILPAALTVTASDRTKTYGQTVVFAGTEFTTTGLVGPDTVTSVTLVSAGAAPTATVAGSPYAITPSAAVGTGLGNYTITYVSGELDVNPAPLTITADDRSKTYGQTVVFAGSEFSATGLLNADDVTSVTLTSAGAAPTATVAGSPYAIVPSAAVGTGLGNYTITYLNGLLTVTPAPLTITADDHSKVYGQTVVFAGSEFSTSGLLNSDSVASVTLVSPGAAATATVAGSPYPITPSAAVGTGLGNYAITYVDGELMLTPAPLTITADDRSKVYGQTVVFAGTEFSTSGLLNADDVTSVTLTSSGAIASATVAGSPYPITPSAAVGTGLGNYTITYLDGALTIAPADAVIVVTGFSVVYDALPHTATGTATGVFGEDLSADLDLSGTTRTAVGSYTDPWTFTDPAGNYNPASGTVDTEILPAALTITADDRTKTYGQTVVFAGTEFTSSGLLGLDTVTSVTLASAGAAATATVAGSPYPITASAAIGTGLTNYAITYVDGALTVDQASLTIAADDQSKASGATFTFAGTEFSTTGLLNADTVDSATLASAGAPAGAAPGTYPITISAAVGTGLASYAITYVPGTFTVGNTTPTVDDASVTTDATMPVSGAVVITDPDAGQTVTATLASGPANGTATVASDGSFTYQPTGTWTGQDSFTIQGCDDNAVPACATGTVSVAVYPVAVPDSGVTSEGQTVEVDVQANDIGDAGAPQIVTPPANGTATIGSIIYTPDAGFAGTDQVVYRVCSPNDQTLCDDATLTITVASNAPPTDADQVLATPLGPVGTGMLQLAGVLALLLVAGCGTAAFLGRRRPTD